MKINPVSMVSVQRQNVNFKGDDNSVKPFIEVTEDMSDDTVVSYSNWGGNYAFPITAGQIRALQALNVQTTPVTPAYKEETPEEYYARKIGSTEWLL